ncbi:MAG: 2-oxoacid:acceptor oxidoreductase subunit alpha [Deltaproteobacteria bacterium]|nr:2-oxoacid:acceptor oxidoreductase subunit alpha [Deltaproteobacteria bacterium]
MAPKINDVNITIATENGTGSASANTVLFQSLFRMGLPCSGKNYFPSNIQGLPTWYQIRVSAQGFLCRQDTTDVMVAFNPVTFHRDMNRAAPGGIVVYDSAAPNPPFTEKSPRREDISWLDLPATALVREQVKIPQLRAKLANMVYVGGAAALLGIPEEVVVAVLQNHFGKNKTVLESNLQCVKLGFDHMNTQALPADRPQLRAIPGGNEGKILTDGNAAAAYGAIWGGASVVAWYPITPSSSVVETMMAAIPAWRTDPAGKNHFAIVQAEDEIASITMTLGAGWAGARAMTATSGPGLSLMQEGLGLAYFTESPCVVFNVMRAGPSTGLPTRTQQSDISLMHQGSHGDTKHLVLIPHDNPSIFEMGWRAFDLADRFQQPVFVMMDLDQGMNISISDPFQPPDQPMDFGKRLSDQDLENLTRQGGVFRRYAATDPDGIAPRTIPGQTHPGSAYFTRGTGHDEAAKYSEDALVYEALLDRLRKKYEHARGVLPQPVETPAQGGAAQAGIISFGSSAEPVREARHLLAAQGMPTSHLLLRALPLSLLVEDFIARHPVVFVVEQNRDGQMTQIIRDDFPQLAPKVKSVRVYNGMPITAGEIIRRLKKEGGMG